MPISLPKDQQDACENLQDSKCPLKADEDVVFKTKLPILKSYPAIKTEFELNLIGDDNHSHSCFKIDGQIVS